MRRAVQGSREIFVDRRSNRVGQCTYDRLTPLGGLRNNRHRIGLRNEALPLIGSREEEVILPDGASQGSAKLIKPQLSGFCVDVRIAGGLAEEVVGIELVVAEKLVDAAVEGVGAGLGDDVDDGRSAVAILRGHIQGEFLEFLDDVGVGGGDDAAAQALVRSPVDQESVEVRAQAIDHSAVTIFKGNALRVDGAGGQLDQVKDVAAVEREVGDLASPDGGRKARVIGLHLHGASFDGDGLRSLADFELEIDGADGAGVEIDAGLHGGLESRGLDSDVVAADEEFRGAEQSFTIRFVGDAFAGADVDDGDVGAGDGGPLRVRNRAGEDAVLYL